MNAGRLPVDRQLRHFRAALMRNQVLAEVLTRAAAWDLPGWYLVAGCLYQTVWNTVTGQRLEAGILDYDLAYFDGSDLSWDAEDAVIQAGGTVFAGLPAPVQIRNQARVHLWYGDKFGVPCPPHESTEAAIDTFEATTACLGVRLRPGGGRVFTPRTGSPTCSTSWCGPTRCSRPARCTRPRPSGGSGSGPRSRCCRGPHLPALSHPDGGRCFRRDIA
jgi:uncharacterized protein